jgi:hypothetical protein
MSLLFKKELIFLSVLLISSFSYSFNEIKLNEDLLEDNKTQLKDILLKDDLITYTYELKDIDYINALGVKDEAKMFIEEDACEDEMLNELFKKDFKVKFVYKMQDRKILEICLNKEFCHQLNNRIANEVRI